MMPAALIAVGVLLVASPAVLAPSAQTTPAACEALQRLDLDRVALTVTRTQWFAAGAPCPAPGGRSGSDSVYGRGALRGSTTKPAKPLQPRSARRRRRGRRARDGERADVHQRFPRTAHSRLRTSVGATLWHAGAGRVRNAPIVYELNGRQYILMGGGSMPYAWTLPR